MKRARERAALFQPTATSLAVVLGAVFVLLAVVLRPEWRIGGDGYSYYSFARTVLYDQDLSFGNERQFFDEEYAATTTEKWRTPTGQAGNPFPVGPALLWSPVILFAYASQAAFDFPETRLPGYGAPYQLAVGLATAAYAAAGIGLLFAALRRLFGSSAAWVATAGVIGISAVPYYLLYEPSMSHGLTLFSTGLLFYLTVRLHLDTKVTLGRVAAVGAAVGLAFLVRWQDVLFGLIPVGILLARWWSSKRRVSAGTKLQRIALYGAALGGPLLLVAAVQLAIWKHLYGSWLTIPQGTGFLDLAHPHLWEFFFSGHHGFLLVHPLLVLGIIGLAVARKAHPLLVGLLALSLLVQIYLNAGLSDWFGGASFGARRMISATFILAFGLAALWRAARGRRWAQLGIAMALVIGIVFNVLLMAAYARQVIPLGAPTSRSEVYAAPFELLGGR